MNEQATVVYADILGFSNLVMSLPGAIGLLDGFYYSSMSLAHLRESFAQEPIPDPLTRTFAAFHRTLDIRISELVNCDPVQSVVFSDSAFVVFRDLNTAICFAQDFMRDLISFRVPIRMGIGRGTFRGLRLTTDISDEVRRHSSQFLGTGVIRAALKSDRKPNATLPAICRRSGSVAVSAPPVIRAIARNAVTAGPAKAI